MALPAATSPVRSARPAAGAVTSPAGSTRAAPPATPLGRRAWRCGALAVAAGAFLVAGCGTPGHDLMVVQRSGSLPGARLSMRVIDDGFVICDGQRYDLTSAQVIAAREVERDLEPVARSGLRLPPRPGSTMRYRIRTKDGTVAFADTSGGQPAVFFRAALLVRRLARGACRLPR